MLFHDPVYVPEVDLTFLPVLRCGSTSAKEMLSLQGPIFEGFARGRTVVMRRDPAERMESLYRWSPREEEFSDWVCRVCATSSIDPHLFPQSHWQADIELAWDWPKFCDLFRIDAKNYRHSRRSATGERPAWTEKAKAAFADKYADDLRIWKELNNGANRAN